MPFSKTVGECIAKTDPSENGEYFRIGLGYAPYQPGIDVEVDTEAYEVMVTYRAIVKIHMTMLFGDVTDYTN